MVAPGPGVAGTTLAGASDTTAPIAVPAGVTSGQIILVDLYLEASRTVTPPSGFTEIGTVAATSTTWHHRFWKRATGSDAGTYSFSWTGATYRRGAAVRYPGCVATGTPYDTGAGAPVSAARSSAGTVTPGVSLTTQGVDRLLVWSGTIFSFGSWTQPTAGGTWTERYDSDEITGAEKSQAVAGATGTVTGTCSASDSQTAWLLALIPGDVAVVVDDSQPAAIAAGSPSGESVEALSINLAVDTDPTAATITGAPGGETVSVDLADPTPAGVVHGAAGGELVSVTVDDAPPAATVVGSPPGETVDAEEPGLPAGGAPFVSLWAVDPVTGGLIRLPHALKVDLSPVRNQAGAFRFDYPAFGRNFDVLHERLVGDQVSLELELWVGGSRFNALGGDILRAEGDDVAEDSVWSFSGKFFTHRLARATVVHDSSAEKGERRFGAATAGTIMRTFLQEAQARGTLTELSMATFSATHDSAGVPWARTVTLKFTPYGNGGLLAVLGRLVDLGLCEGEVDRDKQLLLYNAGGAGRDLTTRTPPTILRRGKDLLESNRRIDVEDAGTDLFGTGAEGLYASTFDATARAKWDAQIEKVIDSNQIEDQAALTAFVQNAREQAVLAPMELTHGLVFGTNRPAPVSGFRINDWLYSDVGRGLERVRVAQWVLSQDVSGIKGSVTLNDIIADRLTRLQRQIAAMSDGSAVVGTSTATLVDDVTPPSAPTGLVIDSIAYQDAEHSQTLAAVTVGWSPVTTNAAGPATERAQAAAEILARILSGDPIAEDWTWTGAPPIVGVHNDALLAAFEDAEPDATSTIGAEGQAWLDAYVATNSAGSSATEDVAGYKVQLAYLGLSQVGGLPSSNPVDEVIAYNEVTPSNGIPDTSYTFGGVEAGANIAVRVAAFDNSGNQSEWSTPIGHDTAVDNVPPEAPSAPAQRIWFRTLDTAWDGLDFAGAPMAADFDHVAVLMSQAASFTAPDPLGEPVLFDPLVTGVQHVANLYGAGTWNQPDLPVGVGWYSALVAVDRAGNVSGMSAITGPATAEQLVSQDLIDDIIDATKLGPDSVESQHVVNAAITSAKILDAAIVTAKIADLAVNNAKIASLDVGKLTAGTLSVAVTNAGIVRSGTSGQRYELDAAALRFYNSAGTQTVQLNGNLNWIAGEIRTALTGERLVLNPDGSAPTEMRLYPSGSSRHATLKVVTFNSPVYGIDSGGIGMMGHSGRVDGATGSVQAYSDYATLLFGDIIDGPILSRVSAESHQVSLLGARVSLSSGDNTGNADEARIRLGVFNPSTNGYFPRSVVLHEVGPGGTGNPASDNPRWVCPDRNIGLQFDTNILSVIAPGTGALAPIQASNVAAPSGRDTKTNIEPLGFDALAALRAAPVSAWEYIADQTRPARPPGILPGPIGADGAPQDRPLPPFDFTHRVPRHIGPMADDLPAEVILPGENGEPLLDYGSMIGTLVRAVQQIADTVDNLSSRAGVPPLPAPQRGGRR